MEPDEQNLALSQGLLGLGAGLLSGSFGHYGAFGPALGQGVQGFTQNFGNALHMSLQRQQMAQQQKLQNAQIANYQSEVDKRKAEMQAQQDAIANGSGADQYANNQFPRPMQPAQATQPTMALAGGSGPATAPTVEVNAKGVSNLLNPDWHLSRAEYLYKKGDRKAAEEAAKRASELRGEEYKLNTPITKMIPAGGDMEQMFELDRTSGKWNKMGEPRHIFSQTPLVRINQQQETAESQGVGTGYAKHYNAIQQAGFDSQAMVNKLDRIDQLLKGVQTGKLAPAGVEIASAAASLGINIDKNLGNKQAAEALSNELALMLRNPSGGSGMPGSLSDADRQFLRSMVPGIEKTPEGRAQIITTMRKLAQRDKEVAKLARDYRKKNGHMDDGFQDTLEEYSNAHPLFSSGQKGMLPKGWSVEEVK